MVLHLSIVGNKTHGFQKFQLKTLCETTYSLNISNVTCKTCNSTTIVTYVLDRKVGHHSSLHLTSQDHAVNTPDQKNVLDWFAEFIIIILLCEKRCWNIKKQLFHHQNCLAPALKLYFLNYKMSHKIAFIYTDAGDHSAPSSYFLFRCMWRKLLLA